MLQTADQALFAHVLGRPEKSVDLAVASLLVGDFEYPGLDVSHYVGVIEQFADAARSEIRVDGEPRQILLGLNDILFGDLGFRGDATNYYDPRNSFLNEVIDRRMGIPISLSVLYMEVGNRLGLDLAGLNFPGHFLVRLVRDGEIFILDPFHGGALLSIEELGDRLKNVLGPRAVLGSEHLTPATKHDIIRRMLNNLAAIYRRAGDVFRAIAVLERQLVVCPDNALLENELDQLRDRAASLN